MMTTQCIALTIVFGCLVTVFAVTATTQTQNAKGLTRDDIVIQRNRATVYLCVDRPFDGNSDLWLKIANNTIWTIRFRAERAGTMQQSLRLSSGKIIAGLTNKSTAFPRYEFETADQPISEGPRWGDFGTANWLPSGNSASFAVRVPHSQTGKLYLEYKYEWEFTSAIADESHGPSHRVYFDVNDVKDFAAHRCPK